MLAPATFDCDDAKAAINVRKHGIPSDEATAVFLDPGNLIMNTFREEDGERREKVIGHIGDRLFAVVFVVRDKVCRLISAARRANASEERFYGDR